jgi:hypothetical protein
MEEKQEGKTCTLHSSKFLHQAQYLYSPKTQQEVVTTAVLKKQCVKAQINNSLATTWSNQPIRNYTNY